MPKNDVIDLDVLFAVSNGDPDTQVRVSRRWLQTAHRELATLRSTMSDLNLLDVGITIKSEQSVG